MTERDTDTSRRDAMEALLPFYLNGTLEGADLVAVEAWLANDPASAVALEEAEEELFGATAANEALRPTADALSRFSKALDQEAGPARVSISGSVFAGLWRRIASLPSGLAWATAAAAVALVLVQAVVDNRGLGDGYEIAGDENDPRALPFVLVAFTPDAPASEIFSLLDRYDAKIVDGPLPSGMLKVALPVKTVAEYDRIAGLIGSAAITAALINARPPTP